MRMHGVEKLEPSVTHTPLSVTFRKTRVFQSHRKNRNSDYVQHLYKGGGLRINPCRRLCLCPCLQPIPISPSSSSRPVTSNDSSKRSSSNSFCDGGQAVTPSVKEIAKGTSNEKSSGRVETFSAKLTSTSNASASGHSRCPRSFGSYSCCDCPKTRNGSNPSTSQSTMMTRRTKTSIERGPVSKISWRHRRPTWLVSLRLP